MLVNVHSGKGLTKDIPIACSLKVEERENPLAEGMRRFRILNQRDGDKRVVWDSYNLQEIRDANDLFNQLIAEGLVPYRVDTKTGKASTEVMEEFDATAEEVIFVPIRALVGG